MRDYAKHQTRRSMQSRVGHVKVIPPGLLKCVALHCLQGDLLTQKDITHREIALRRKAPVRNYIARSIQFMNVHRLAASDAIAGSGVRTHDFKLVQSVPLLRLLWAQPGTKKSKAPLFNFCAVDRYRRRVADQANDEHQKAQCNGDIGRQFQLIKALFPAIRCALASATGLEHLQHLGDVGRHPCSGRSHRLVCVPRHRGAGASEAAGAGQRASAAGGVESMMSVITLMVGGGDVEL